MKGVRGMRNSGLGDTVLVINFNDEPTRGSLEGCESWKLQSELTEYRDIKTYEYLNSFLLRKLYARGTEFRRISNRAAVFACVTLNLVV